MKKYVKYAVSLKGVLFVGNNKDDYLILGILPDNVYIKWEEPCYYEIKDGFVSIFDKRFRRIFSAELEEYCNA